MRNPIAYGYTHMIYEMTFKLAPYLELPYIGYAQNFNRRLKTHVFDAFEALVAGDPEDSSLINHAQIIAMETELNSIRNQIISLDSSISSQDIQDLTDLRYWWSNAGKYKDKVVVFIVNEVIKKHFNVRAIEYHKSLDNAKASEKANTLALIHTIGGRSVTGTITPYGLNMRMGGSGGGGKQYPILDILLLAALGFTNNKITEIITKVYGINFDPSTLGRKIGPIEDIYSLVLKPIFLDLLSYREDNTKTTFSLKEIGKVLKRAPDFVRTKVSKWFEGLSVPELKYTLNTGIDLDNIKTYLSSVQRVVRSHSQQTWIDWIISTTKAQLASKSGISVNLLDSKIFIHQLATYLFSNNKIYYLDTLKGKLRIDRGIELLRTGTDPKSIMEDTFQVEFKSISQLKSFYESLFSTQSRISFSSIIITYSSLSGYYLGKYK